MIHTIWTSEIDYDRDWRDFMEEEYPDLNESEREALAYELNADYLDDEIANLNIPTSEPILAIADLGLWDGRRDGYRYLPRNVNAIFDISEDFNTYYMDAKGNVRATCHHHDGTNYILYREWKPGIGETARENFLNKLLAGKLTPKDITRCTRSLGPYVKGVYGW